MEDKIRVLIVDNSAFMRVFISDMINNEKDMEVVGTARNGDVALEKIDLLDPDVITLDVEMPGKNGLEVLKDIKHRSCSKVIMLSGLTTKGSSITIEALEAGAFDFIQKPSGIANLELETIRAELTTKIRYAYEAKNSKKCVQHKDNDIEIKKGIPLIRKGEITAIALGASTGGPKTLYEILTALPGDLGVPIFVVQHMPAGFTKAFAERLDANCQLRVVEAADRDVIQPGVVYVAPGGFHMTVQEGMIKLDTSPPLHGVRPAVDILLKSAAKAYGSGLLCCIFTGMGKDGAAGVITAKKAGGIVLAQDEATSVIYGMPKAAYETGYVDWVLPSGKIAQEITNLVRR